MPDTLITLITGDKYMVRDSPQETISAYLEFRRSLFVTAPNLNFLPEGVLANTLFKNHAVSNSEKDED